jgi:phosphatidylserine decarboxylase
MDDPDPKEARLGPAGVDKPMKAPAWRERLLLQEDLNFLLTNRVPRLLLTRLMGRFSRIRSRPLARVSIAVWRLFTDLDFSDAETDRFDSLHACFTRALKPGARPIAADPQVVASPCDAIVGACGAVQAGSVLQAKGFPYRLADLLGREARAAPFHEGTYVTLRLTSSMYHRFHAPHDGRAVQVTHFSGDTWNVNPIALARIERLFCRNERAAIEYVLDRGGHRLMLVPVAAILVASLRLHWLRLRLHTGYRGPDEIACDQPFAKGQEMGWFEHGSTIIVLAPPGFALAPGIAPGQRVRMGEALLTLPRAGEGSSRDRHSPGGA